MGEMVWQITWMWEEGCVVGEVIWQITWMVCGGGDGLADHMDEGRGLCGREDGLADHMDDVWWREMVWQITWMREEGCVVGEMVWQITWMREEGCGGSWAARSHG